MTTTPDTGLLFEVPPSPSPRVAWIAKHQIRLHHCPGNDDEWEPWCAWLPDNDHDEGTVPIDLEACGFGKTQDDALVDLASIHGLPHWSKEGPR